MDLLSLHDEETYVINLKAFVRTTPTTKSLQLLKLCILQDLARQAPSLWRTLP